MLAFPISMMKVPTGSSYDADAQTFFTAVEGAGGTIGSTAKQAYSDFITSGKADGWWAHILWLMPFLGDFTAAMLAHANGLGTLTPTIDNFVSGDYSEATGLTGNGSSKKIRTGVIPPAPTGGLSAYIRGVPTTATRAYLGASDGTDTFRLYRNLTTSDRGLYGAASAVSLTVAASDGHFHARRESSTSFKLWHDGAQHGATQATSVTPGTIAYDLWAFAQNNSGAANIYVAAESPISFLSIDNGTMSDAEANAFGADVEALQDALSRGVV